MRSTPVIIAVIFASLAPLLAIPVLLGAWWPGHVARASESGEEYALELPGTTWRTGVVAGRVLEPAGNTETPVSSATFRVYGRNPCPGRSLVPVGSGKTDEHGIVNVDIKQATAQYVVLAAPGFSSKGGPWGDWVHSATTWPVSRRKILVLDPVGSPLSKARIEVFDDHPGQAAPFSVGVTDAQGVVEFSDVDPRTVPYILISARGVHLGPYRWPRHTVGHELPVLHTRVGRHATGRVIDMAGRPVRGAILVGGYRPWGAVATTDDAGGFEIVGLGRDEPLWVYEQVAARSDPPSVVVPDFDEATALVLTMGSRIHGAGETWNPVEIEFASITGYVDNFGGSRVRLVRRHDGLTVNGWVELPTDRGLNLCRVLAPAGRYRITMGRPLDHFRAGPVEAILPSSPEKPSRVPTRLQTIVNAEIRSDTPPERAWIAVPRDSREVKLAPSSRDPAMYESVGLFAFLAPDDPAALWAVAGPLTWRFDVGPDTLVRWGRRPRSLGSLRFATGEFPARTTVTYTVGSQGAENDEVQAKASRFDDSDIVETEPDGRVVIRTWVAGRQRLTIRGEGLIPHSLDVALPHVPGGKIDLGTISLRRPDERRIRFAYADGSPAAGLCVTSSLTGCDIDSDGFADVWIDPEGSEFFIQDLPYGWCDQYLAYDRESSGELRLEGGEVSLAVTDMSGETVEGCIAILDGENFDFDSRAEFKIKGVSAGKHVLIVGASAHTSYLYRFELRRDGSRFFPIQLKRR